MTFLTIYKDYLHILYFSSLYVLIIKLWLLLHSAKFPLATDVSCQVSKLTIVVLDTDKCKYFSNLCVIFMYMYLIMSSQMKTKR